MLRRFSLYGFLKNQQYYDPFMVLAFLQMGLSFTQIGFIIAFREIMINIMEIPTGGIADLYGRRRAMIFSFIAYIISFGMLGGTGLWALREPLSAFVIMPLICGAMVFFAIGDAFRTGTHKAMIFTWLRIQGRVAERTKVYGYTRSWSKIGSALSVVLAGIFVYVTSNYVYIFFFSIIPYILNIINFMGYPAEVDGDVKKGASVREVMTHLKEAFIVAVRQASLRRLMFESMGYEGFFKAAKDYLQPILKAAALPLSAMLFASVVMNEEQKSVILIVPVYCILFIASAVASRKAHVLVDKHGSEEKAARFLWLISFVILAALAPAIYLCWYWAIILGFVALYILQNLWRPVLISRFDTHSDESKGATVLSIESQAKSAATMLIAPLLGYMVDLAAVHKIGCLPFWPVAVFGALIALIFFLTAGTGEKEETNHQ